MTINEILLVSVTLIGATILWFLIKKLNQPWTTYIRLTAGVLMLILFWFFTDKTSFKILMTLFIIAGSIKTIKEYKVFTENLKNKKN